MTVTLTRNCRGVSCSAEDGDPLAMSCLGGRCVVPGCLRGDEPECGADRCTGAADCAAPAARCGGATCVEGACLLVADAARCGEGEQCVPERGCEGNESPATECSDMSVLSAAENPVTHETAYPPDVALAAIDDERFAATWPATAIDDGAAGQLVLRSAVLRRDGTIESGPWESDISAPAPGREDGTAGDNVPRIGVGYNGVRLFFIAGWDHPATWETDLEGNVVGEAPAPTESVVSFLGTPRPILAGGRWHVPLGRDSEWTHGIWTEASPTEGENVLQGRYFASGHDGVRHPSLTVGASGRLAVFGVSPHESPQRVKRCLGRRANVGGESPGSRVGLEVVAGEDDGTPCFGSHVAYHEGLDRYGLFWNPGSDPSFGPNELKGIVFDGELTRVSEPMSYAASEGVPREIDLVWATESGWSLIVRVDRVENVRETAVLERWDIAADGTLQAQEEIAPSAQAARALPLGLGELVVLDASEGLTLRSCMRR